VASFKYPVWVFYFDFMIFIFDLLGVVVDWKSEYVIPDLARYAGVSDVEFKQKMKKDFALCDNGKIPVSELFSSLGGLFGVDPSGLESILRTCFSERAKLNEGVVKLVQSLPDAVLLSNQTPLHAEIARKKGWFSYFSRVFLSYELGYSKPSAEAYRFVLKELGVKPEEAVLIDDKQENIDGARALGMHGILYKGAVQLKADLEKIYKPSMSK